MEIKVLTQEEIISLTQIRDKRNQLIGKMGENELQIQQLNLQKQDIIEELKGLIQFEIKLGKELQDKYGEGSIDLEKGEFISS